MIRVLQSPEIASVVPLLEAAYQRKGPFAERLERYLAIEPQGWLVAERDGEKVGMVGVVVHGAAAYVGLMAVLPSRQSQGLGRQLLAAALAFARSRHAGLVMLDASDAGAPLYRSAGFADRGPTHDCVYQGPQRGSPRASRREAPIDEILAFDRDHFGADRSRTLRVFAAAHPGRLVALRRAGKVAAYALAQRGIIGPVVAEDDDATREVLDAALRLPFDGAPRLIAPGLHLALLEAEGFRVTRSLLHMRLGGPEVAYRVVGKVSLGVG